MASFPSLKTGAVAQYPVKTTYLFRTDTVWFLDGSEQRFRNSASTLHRWEIDLSKLDEQEMASIEQFFLVNQGTTLPFAFTDPWSGSTYANCSIDGGELGLVFDSAQSGSTKIAIRENRT